MQTCSRCSNQSPDTAMQCEHCQADLRQFSTVAVALAKHRANPRVLLIKVAVMADACPVCGEARGTYDKDTVPHLPVEGCSNPQGCRCFYEPSLSEIFP